ncbi:MAG: helix-turn-helix transcriptional regulator [Alphaproteobacteria bacterium]|nr:helix-turn-helix transcriptional regulator [Alphaproteobacteria bacterium]
MKLTHREIWTAIDRLAARNDLSTSGLAIKAGLNPTTFNPSKRVNRSGRQRWPSTESVHKILEISGTSAVEFLGLVENGDNAGLAGMASIPLGSFEQHTTRVQFNEKGKPLKSSGWDAITFPGQLPDDLFALEITGKEYSPILLEGDRLIASAKLAPRRGDRVIVATLNDQIILGIFTRATTSSVEFTDLSTQRNYSMPVASVRWIARILWIGQ